MPNRVKIIAVGLLTQDDLTALGPDYRRSFPVEDLGNYDGLLRALELADDSYNRHMQESFASGRLKQP